MTDGRAVRAPDAAELVTLPAERAVRLLALSLLDVMVEQHDSLVASDGSDAVHDFRVAVRRLRSCLRAYEPQLRGSVPRRARRDLRKLADAAGDRRDLDVRLAWLAEQRATLTRREQVGAEALRAMLDTRRVEASDVLRRALAKRFARAVDRLRTRLAVYETTVQPEGDGRTESFAAIAAEHARALGEALEERLTDVHTVDDDAAAHRARITAKRLRYLLEPIRAVIPDGAELIEQLTSLQDTLGELHDAHVFAADLIAAVPAIAGEHARQESLVAFEEGPLGADMRRVRRLNPRAGLIALGMRLRRRADDAFATAASEWLGGRDEAFEARLRAACEALASQGTRAVRIHHA